MSDKTHLGQQYWFEMYLLKDQRVVIPRGLVVNQKEDINELPGFYSTVASILGYVVEPKEILYSWSGQG